MLAVLAATAPAPAPAAEPAAEPDWRPATEREGIALEWRPTDTVYRAFRGSVSVCTDLDGLQGFVGDATRLTDWVPYTEAARVLPAGEGQQLYYLRTRAPWPFQSRDMVYQLTRERAAGDAMIIALEGRPDALPEQRDAVRMRSAKGRWTLEPRDGRIDVTLELTADPRAPAFYANHRLAATVAGTLANLAERFPCDGAGSS